VDFFYLITMSILEKVTTPMCTKLSSLTSSLFIFIFVFQQNSDKQKLGWRQDNGNMSNQESKFGSGQKEGGAEQRAKQSV